MKRSITAILMIVLAACVTAATIPAPTLAANPNVGYVDFAFGSAPGDAPTSDKPQSKLWFNDGAWWAVLFNTGAGNYHIYRLTWPDQWVDTGTSVDDRALSHADALWDGTHLYIASTLSNNETNAANQGRLYRYSYSGGAYTLNANFPAVMMTGSIESLTFDKDTTGQLWITFTLGKKVYVNHSTTDDATWGTPFVIPGPTTATNLNVDDISALVAYTQNGHGAIGVLWSNHNDPSSMYFAYHTDGDPEATWSSIESIYAPEVLECAADDHINIKSLQSDASGSIYAALKTSVNDPGCGGTSSSPSIRLVVRKSDNTWKMSTFGTVADDHTRPLVLLDTTNRMVYMFATSSTSCGIIYMKSTSMDTLSFPPGKGTPFISSSTYTCINNATSTKQTVNASTGLVVMASDEKKFFYLHNALALGSPPADTIPPTVTARSPLPAANAVAVATNVTATFSEALNPATVSTTSVRLLGPGATSIAAAVSYDVASKTITLNPSADLNFSSTYTAQLTGALTDLAGNALVPVSWNFTTAAAPATDTTPPIVTARSPSVAASAVAVATNVTATFSEALNSATVGVASVRLLGPGATSVPAAVSYDAASQTVTLNPSTNLSFGTSYTVQLSGAITDLAGNALVPVSWSFTTIAAAPATDTTPPTVTANNPSNGASSIGLSTSVTATFSEAIDSATISSANFTLVAGTSAVAASVSYDPATRTATLQPTSALSAGTIYTATISGVKDLAGNTIAAPVTWSFITGAAPAPNQKFVFLPVVLR